MVDYLRKDEKTGGIYIEDIRRLSLTYRESLGSLEKFYKGLKDGKVYYSECEECGYRFYPPRNICPKCGSGDIKWSVLSRRGILITFAEMNVKPLTHAHYDDYILGIGEFDGIKILGLIDGRYEELSIGLEIEWDVSIREPDKYPVIVFKPIRK